MKVTLEAALARIQSRLKAEGVPQAIAELRRLHRAIKPQRFTFNQLAIDLARRVQMADPKSALELIDFILKSSPNDDAAIVLAIGLCDRTGDQVRARELADKIVRQSQSATPEQKITAANLLVRLLDDPISIETALEAYETLGRPLQWASTVLYIAQRSAHWGAVNEIIKQLKAAYAEGGQLHVTRESPRTHVLWCDDEQINIDVLKYWSSTTLRPKARAIPVAPLGGRKIKLGYLSSDYREHPTSRLVNGLFRHHDRSRFELHMYCSGWDDGSPMRREVESHFDYIHQVTNLSDEKAAELIRSHGIDVLVELNGPTRANRMGIMAERAAPVQIDYLGWPGSVGGGPVDYVIGDYHTVPEGAEKLYPERVIRIDQIYQVNDYAARTLPPAPSRASMGLPEDVLVIGMFNAINKVRADVWRVWMEILKAVPNSVLWILDPGKAARKYIGTYTKALGVDPKRIMAAPNLRQEAHLARLQCCDLMLDPWPYGGHTSTSDALFAGVPVVAMKCNNFAGRVSAGLLSAAGLEQLVATDIQQYARIAVHLLCNPGELEKVKAFVRTVSPKRDVFNAAGKARQLEQAYRVALERAIEGLPPRHIAFQPPEVSKSVAAPSRSVAAVKAADSEMRIYYINLDRSPDRRANMESLLSAHGLLQHAKRHPGIVPARPLNNLTISETGCLLSNLSLINSLSEEKTALILEDDVCFAPDFGRRIDPLLKSFADTKLDLLFFGQTVLFNDLNMHRQLIKVLSLSHDPKQILLDASKSYKFGSFAYAVNGKSIAKIQKLIRAIDLEASATPIDVKFKKWLLSNKLKGAVVFPYLVGVNPEFDTTINDRLRVEDHPLHASAVNLYLEGQSLDGIKTWKELLEQGPNEQALGLCKLIYDRLTR